MARTLRRFRPLALILSLASAGATRAADGAAFDLAGPALGVTVTRGGVTLPIDAVPDLAAGDRVAIRADLPPDQRARYLLVAAFLSGATNPPPKAWISEAETWRRKEEDRALALTVPDGARQLVLFLVPDTGGARGTIADAVRGRPGEFVRATQGLNQASLDRSRLDAFVAAIRAEENSHPEHLRTVAPALAKSLAIRLNEDCLARVIEMQAACLIENRDALVLPDIHSSSVAEALVGAPTDLALQVSYTREGGFGAYSPYIGVIRDLARVFGAFGNPQFRYLPALSARSDARVALLLNVAPSFSKPRSAIVAALPAIGGDTAPRLRSTASGPLCGTDPALVLPVDGAPLIYATGYAHDMMLRLDGSTADVPLVARAERGGFVPAAPLARPGSASVEGQIRGRWGFVPFEGPRFALQFPQAGGWRAETPRLTVGRDEEAVLTGTAPACVSGVSMRTADGNVRAIAWKPAGEGAITATMPLKDAVPGEVTILVRQHGVAEPAAVTLRADRQASRIDAASWHAGDRAIDLIGQRLDQIADVAVGEATLTPGALQRQGDADLLRVSADRAIDAPKTARIRLKDGRILQEPVATLPPRPAGSIVSRTIELVGDRGRRLVTTDETLLPDRARVTVAIKAAAGVRFTPLDTVEVRTADDRFRTTLAAGGDVRQPAPDMLVATLDAGRLGPAAAGPVEFRIVSARVAGDWQPLARLVRLPTIDAVVCPAGGGCTIGGRDLFLIDSVAGVAVPAGYTASTLAVAAPTAGTLPLRLRDAPEAIFVLSVP